MWIKGGQGIGSYVRAGTWCAIVGYSLVRALTTIRYAWSTLGGDMVATFPGPLALRIGEAWPGLARPWVVEHLAMGPRKWAYGPVLHIVTLPCALLPTQLDAMRMMFLWDGALLAATFLLWTRLLLPQGRPPIAAIAMACLWINFFPLIEVLVGREIEILELFLVTLGVWALRRARQNTAGAAFGIAAMTKFLPVIFVLYLFVKGYRRAGYVAVGAVLGLAVVAQPLMGWQWSATLLSARDELQGRDVRTSYANQGLTNVLLKTFTARNTASANPPSLYPNALLRIGVLVSAGVALATAAFVIRWRRSPLLELECALLLIVMCLVALHANTYYFIFALPALSLGVTALWLQPDTMRPQLKAVLAAASISIGFLVPMRILELVIGVRSVEIARALQMWCFPAYGAILAVGLMLELHRLAREPHRAAVSAV